MKNKSFDELQKELQATLKVFMDKTQNGGLEAKAQKAVDEVFKRRKARRKIVVNDAAGIEVVGAVLAFDIGRIGLKHYKTAFWPKDKWHVCLGKNNSCVPLGYVNNYQLYIQPQEGLPPTLMARFGPGSAYSSWNPNIAGMPPTDSVFFVALERAKALGWLKFLRSEVTT